MLVDLGAVVAVLSSKIESRSQWQQIAVVGKAHENKATWKRTLLWEVRLGLERIFLTSWRPVG
ncbi:hypothetical protein GCM10027597_35390 [Saccharopolyspora tripterygii]